MKRYTLDKVGYSNENLQEKALTIAEKLQYTLEKDADCCLWVREEGLALKLPGIALFSTDFNLESLAKLSQGKKQGLLKACKPHKGLKILDVTAGWGKDAALLAYQGAEVLMLERHPAIAALLADALDRRNEKEKQALQLALIQTDALDYLKQLPIVEYPDIIYIDPMHPERTKSALVKKNMQLLQQLLAPNEDIEELILLAITRAKHKVIVKWPQKIPALLPTYSSIEGKTVRFDIYPPKSQGIHVH